MANHYRAVVHYHFKNGMEEEGVRFLERELIKKAKEYGCHDIELWQNDRDPAVFTGVALWNDIQDARRFQSLWEKKEKEFLRYCTGTPHREFYRVRATFLEKSKKAA